MKLLPPRAEAAKFVNQVIEQGRSLTPLLQRLAENKESSMIKALSFGACRYYPQLDLILKKLLNKPLARKHSDIHALLIIGLYQLKFGRQPEYASVSETVAATLSLGKQWAKSMVNAVLRNYQRNHCQIEKELENDLCYQWAHPRWLIELIKSDWPNHWQNILSANNTQAAMVLRVNLKQIQTNAYLQQLELENFGAKQLANVNSAIELNEAQQVTKLPGFNQGLVSVQDSSAQLAAGLLEVQPEHSVLDACSAPGNKACHIAETQPRAKILALDQDPQRLQRITDNITRLQLQNCIQEKLGDASKPQDWWQGSLFDRILLDVPCSATGVIRRHPDIKILRRQSDIADLCDRQQSLLRRLWDLLAAGGILLYCTCSLLSQENEIQITRFLQFANDARERPIAANWGIKRVIGRQILPEAGHGDGMYFARLEKTTTN